jgi:hypothetical protein
MKNCTFENFNFCGSVIYTNLTLGSLTVIKCVFKLINKISGDGGAMYLNIPSNTKVEITDCTFTSCKVRSEGTDGFDGIGGYGGAIYINIFETANLKLNGPLTFTSNHAELGWDIFINGVFIYFNILFYFFF